MAPQPIARIQSVVADVYGLSRSEMLGRCSCRYVAWPRQVAMYLAREETKHSRTVIGKLFDRDPSTVYYAIRAVEDRMDADAQYRGQVEELRDTIRKQRILDQVDDPVVRKILIMRWHELDETTPAETQALIRFNKLEAA